MQQRPGQLLLRESVPTVDLGEPRTRRPWAWVCAALVNRDKGDCGVRVLDSVFVDKQQIWAWYYATADRGVVRRRPQRKLSAPQVHDAFVRLAARSGVPPDASDADSALPVAVCWFDSDSPSAVPFFTAAELWSFLHSLATTSACSACVSAFVRPRGDLDPTCYANLEHEFTLHKSGRVQGKLSWLALGGQRVPNKDAKLHAAVHELVQHVVGFLERSRKCRVARCVALFVLDERGQLRLWRTAACETIPLAAALPSSVATSTSTAPATATASASPLSTAFPRSYDGPSAVNERLLARARAQGARQPDEQLVDAILAAPTPPRAQPAARMRALLTAASSLATPARLDPLGDLERSRGAQLELPRGTDWDDALHFLPSCSSLSRGRRRAVSAAHLVSSQKRGCCGDFCRVSVAELTTRRMERKHSASLREQAGRARKGRRRSSLVSATAAASAFLDARQAADVVARLSQQQQQQQPKPTSPQRRQQHESQSQSQSEAPTHAIPFKLVAQTRAEKPLVELFLRRYERGERGAYLAEAYYGDGEPLGVTFPGYYYRDVLVCANCFELYVLVEKVRMQALAQVARKAQPASPPRKRPPASAPVHKDQDALEDAHEDAREDVHEDALRRVWPPVWAHATGVARAISKRDAAELYSFVSPHPAVAMVLSALGALLLASRAATDSPARCGDWGELKRSVSQDKLLARVQHVALSKLPVRAVLVAAAHARNPLFTPAHVAPVSSCAARFCAWVRAVLQAFAWRYGERLEDADTRHALRFLRPELLPAGVTEAQGARRTSARAATSPRPRDDASSRPGQRPQAVRRALQAQQMARLAAPAGLVGGLDGGGERVFTCQDGVTRLPYAVAGQAAGETLKCHLVVFHDLFDTLESTRVLFRPLVARHVGARVLLFNLPGQAGASFAVDDAEDDAHPDERVVLNNVWLARRVHELLGFLQHSAQFVTRGAPFHLVGFGNGANVAACYAALFGDGYGDDLQSLALFNGFARVDAQLAAVLHSAVNVFSCLPPTRPDLPVSFLAQFLFSETYLRRVDLQLALSIYTAVTNAITLDGRLRLCRGALRHEDLSAHVAALRVPLVLVQSVENALVAPSNVDAFLQGRASVQHVWSHQQTPTRELCAKTRHQLRRVLQTPRAAFVSWLRAGHELRQEAKSYVADVLEQLVNAKAEPPPEPKRERPSHSVGVGVGVGVGDASRTPTRNDAAAEDAETAAEDAEPEERDVQAAVATAPLVTSALELQLERSERAAQDALRTRGAHNAAHEPQEQHEPQAQQALALSACVARATLAVDAVPPALPAAVAPLAAAGARTPPSAPTDGGGASDDDVEAVRARVRAEAARAQHEAHALHDKQRVAAEARLAALRDEQERRRREWAQQDRARLAQLEAELQTQQAARVAALQQREHSQLQQDGAVLAASPPPALSSASLAVVASPARAAASSALLASSPEAVAQQIRQQPELPSVFDALEAAEQARGRQQHRARALGGVAAAASSLLPAQYDDVREALRRDVRADARAHASGVRRELRRRRDAQATQLQSYLRRFLASRRVARRRREQQQQRVARFAGGEIVRVARGRLGRGRATRVREAALQLARRERAATRVQTVFRGFCCRVAFRAKLQASKARVVQRVYRGHAGRARARALRAERTRRRFQDRHAATLQATWRMFVARGAFLNARVSELAARELQRVYRGRRGRREAARKRQWRDAPPGAERLALGLQLLEGAKQAAARQQRELDALHRAQEAAETQVSAVHRELREAEAELAVLERELHEIDQLDADVRELTHEAERLHARGLAGLLRSQQQQQQQQQALGSGVPEATATTATTTATAAYEAGAEQALESKSAVKQRQAEAFAVEMALSIKRSERERRQRELEAEFAGAFAEVQRKRDALAALELELAAMEQTRVRKDREFARLQRQLLELLEEQKLELERLREQGVELETATATSAAAAAATAAKAREHEARSQAMFASTEELMKFQFMSMSLSYFSSLNMLQNLRELNADTTAAAVTSTAETAATAAAAAAAANIAPVSSKRDGNLLGGLLASATQRQHDELASRQREEAEALAPERRQPLPEELRLWSVDDVGRWLESLSLPQYRAAFREGAVDGDFLVELRAEDLADVLGVSHKLHVRKLLAARDKLLPLTAAERAQLSAVNHEANAARHRGQDAPAEADDAALELDAVFSQARNGRMKRLVESLDAGFPVDSEDDKGNTLLLLACQNVNQRMVELLVARRANVNHRNAQGNTPLHFAMAYDAEGTLGEYLIARGADDTIENASGLTPYDGLTAE